MFNRIAGRYDLLNRLLSLRIDVVWRRRMLRHLPVRRDVKILDVATGTGDVLLTLARKRAIGQGVGIDPAVNMLEVGRNKMAKHGLADVIKLFPGNAMYLPVQDGTFDVATIAFGIRNVPDVQAALREMHRVLDEQGRLLVLEFSLPGNKIIRNIYLFYFRFILPKIGGWISGDHTAYSYLNRTVEDFPYGAAFKKMLLKAGFVRVQIEPMTLGIATLYIAEKI